MDLLDDPTIINGDFNLINEISDDYDKSDCKRNPESIEIMLSICIGSLSSQINKPNRVDFHDKRTNNANPWVYKKDRVEHLEKIKSDELVEEVAEQESYLLRDLEYMNYVSEVEYPDETSVNPKDYIKCTEFGHKPYSYKHGFVSINDNSKYISNIFLEFTTDLPIELYDFFIYLTNFDLVVKYGLKYNFLPDIIYGLLTDFDFCPDVGKFVIKFTNPSLFANNLPSNSVNNTNHQISWCTDQTIFDVFNIKLYQYGRYVEKDLINKLYPKNKPNIELFSEKELIIDYVSGNKHKLRDMYYYTQVFGFAIKKEINPDFPDDFISFKKIEIIANGMGGLFYGHEDWVFLEFSGLKVYLIMLDPMLKDLDKFKEYLRGSIDYEHVSGINLARIDTVKFKIDLNTIKPINIHIFNLGLRFVGTS